ASADPPSAGDTMPSPVGMVQCRNTPRPAPLCRLPCPYMLIPPEHEHPGGAMRDTNSKHHHDDGDMTRRAFVGAGLLGGAAALADRHAPRLASLTRGAERARPAAAPRAPDPFELDEVTIAQLQDAMQSGKYTSRQITELYLARIGELDQSGPALNQVLETNPDALAIADALDAERRAQKVRGPLHGIPILLKDNIATADRMTT